MSIDIPAALRPFKRPAWKPVVSSQDGSCLASKFSGTPYLKPNEAYPLCQNCREPMQLFIQLNFNELPRTVVKEFGDGLLQMFYCTNTEPHCAFECEAFFPFAKSVLVRIIQPEHNDFNDGILPPVNSFPPKLITGWEERGDYPNPKEGEALGIKLDESEWYSMIEEGLPLDGDKLAGYPDWILPIDYSDCPLCGATMRFVFQLDSEDNLPFMFGNMGCGHIIQCPTHKDQLAFAWAGS